MCHRDLPSSSCYLKKALSNLTTQGDRNRRPLGVRRERERTEIPESPGRRRQDRCNPRIGTAVSAEPLPLELAHPEERRAVEDALRLLSGTGGRCRIRIRNDGLVDGSA